VRPVITKGRSSALVARRCHFRTSRCWPHHLVSASRQFQRSRNGHESTVRPSTPVAPCQIATSETRQDRIRNRITSALPASSGKLDSVEGSGAAPSRGPDCGRDLSRGASRWRRRPRSVRVLLIPRTRDGQAAGPTCPAGSSPFRGTAGKTGSVAAPSRAHSRSRNWTHAAGTLDIAPSVGDFRGHQRRALHSGA